MTWLRVVISVVVRGVDDDIVDYVVGNVGPDVVVVSASVVLGGKDDDVVTVVGTVVVNDVDGGVVSLLWKLVAWLMFVQPSVNMLQPFLCFFLSLGFIYFFNLVNFYPVTRFLVTPLLVTRYSLLVTALLCLVRPF